VISVKTKGIDRHGGDLAMVLTGHEGKVNSIAYSIDGLCLASGSEDGTVRLWDTRTGQEAISPLRSGEDNVTSVAFSPDGKFVASGTRDGPIHIWDVKSGRLSMSPLLGHDGSIACVAFSPDGTLIASAGSDRLVRFWSVETGQLLAAIEGHTESVNAVAFNLTGNILASCSHDGTVRQWDPRTHEPKGISFDHPDSWAISLAYASDGSAISVGFNGSSEVHVWDTDFASEIVSVIKTEVPPDTIAFSPGTQYILTPGANGIVSWNW